MDNAAYHVLLYGQKVGPYDRRTIVGMRIKKMLTDDHVLIAADGSRTTVAQLIGQTRGREDATAGRDSSFPAAHATFPARVAQVDGSGFEIPRFKGDVEARVQPEVLRIAGRFRQGLRWKDGRIKIPIKDVVHTRIADAQVELWLRPPGPEGTGQRLVLEMSSASAGREFIGLLPGTTPFPGPGGVAAPRRSSLASGYVLWLALASVVLVVGLMLAVLVYRRLH